MDLAELHRTRAETIRKRRMDLDLTITEAAHRAGVSIPTWERLEDPDTPRQPQDRSLRSASRALRWAPDSLHRLEVGATADQFLEVGAPVLTAAGTVRGDSTAGWGEAAEILMMLADLPGASREAILEMTRKLWSGRVES